MSQSSAGAQAPDSQAGALPQHYAQQLLAWSSSLEHSYRWEALLPACLSVLPDRRLSCSPSHRTATSS